MLQSQKYTVFSGLLPVGKRQACFGYGFGGSVVVSLVNVTLMESFSDSIMEVN